MITFGNLEICFWQNYSNLFKKVYKTNFVILRLELDEFIDGGFGVNVGIFGFNLTIHYYKMI